MKIIKTQKAPKAVGPYSQAIKINGLLFCSGQIGVNPKTGKLAQGIKAQTKQVLVNLKSIITAANLNTNNIVKTTIYLTNIKNYETVNNIYSKFFKNHKPARATISISSLPKNALIEIDAIAHE